MASRIREPTNTDLLLVDHYNNQRVNTAQWRLACFSVTLVVLAILASGTLAVSFVVEDKVREYVLVTHITADGILTVMAITSCIQTCRYISQYAD